MLPEYRPRRSCLAVPASSQRFIDSARGLPADEVFLDLEDAVAPAAKAQARRNAIAAVTAGGWQGKLLALRINDATTRWAYRDVVEVVAAAGHGLDAVLLPKVTGPAHIAWLDLLLGQIELDSGGDRFHVRQPAGVLDLRLDPDPARLAAASPRLRALVFGPADFMASVGMKSLRVGAQPAGYPGDAFHYPLMRMLVAARSRGLAAIDGPYLAIRDTDGLRAAAASAAALGYDGKWVLHPGQIGIVNEAFSPSQDDYERAELILDAYRYYTEVEHRGAAMLGDEMIDEASRKLALVTAARGRAAGLARCQRFEPGQAMPGPGRPGSAQDPPAGEGLGQAGRQG